MTNTNKKEKLISSGLLVIELFKVSMACFLTLFVPQECGDDQCTFTDVITFDDPLRLTTFIVNCVTFLVFMGSYCIEQRREHFIISHFNVDKNLGDKNLIRVPNHSNVFSQLQHYNNTFLQYTRFTMIMMLVNTVISAVLLAYYFNGVQTLTSGISYILIMSVMLYENYDVAFKSRNNRMALSSIVKEPVSYNAIELK